MTTSVIQSAGAAPSNGDYLLTPVSEATYTAIDLTNWGRNIFTVVKDGFVFAKNELDVAAKITGVAGTVLFGCTVVAAGALVVTGAASFYAAHKWTIPKAKEDLR